MKMKEALGCLLSFPAPMVPHPNAEGWMCSRGSGGLPLMTVTVMVGVFQVRIPMGIHVESCTA